MKKLVVIVAAIAVLVGVGVYVFQQQAVEPKDDPTANMFVDSDTDAFDPGLPIGALFPAIRARYQGQEITGIDQFMGSKGTIFFANRSVDW